MKKARDPLGVTKGKAMLDQLPELYSAVIKSMQIEPQEGGGIRCVFNLPWGGKRSKSAATAREAVRAALAELSDVLTQDTTAWTGPARRSPAGAASNARDEGSKRFQSKTPQFTVGVTMPTTFKVTLQEMARSEDTSFADMARRMISAGFEDFDERSFSEGSRELLAAFALEIRRWSPSESEQVMIRLEPHQAVRLRSAAKEYERSASEFGALCLAHGFALNSQMVEIEQKIAAVRGSAIRGLAPKVGLGTHVALLSGILAGTIRAPAKVLRSLAGHFGAAEPSLAAFFRHSFATRAVPAFKAENGKPELFAAATSWEDAVKALNLQRDQAEELLKLDEQA